MNHCELINGGFSIFIQMLLGFIAIVSLILKRKFFENPRRNRTIWLYDISKQIIGQMFAHACNILIALILAKHKDDTDPCEWYLINYMLDTVIGVLICYMFIKLLNKISYRYNKPFLRSGNYLSNNRCNGCRYMIQLSLWLSIILLSKIIILLLILVPFKSLLQKFGDILVHPLVNDPKTELVVVMIIVPLVMNSFQYWIQDTFLKDRKDTESVTDYDSYYHRITDQYEI